MNINDLKTPKNNPVVTAIAKLLLPLGLMKARLHVAVAPDLVTALRRLRNQPTVLLVNHADRYDPLVALALSAAAGEDFWYLAARELFDKPFDAWLMQNIGAYSVVRGQPDDTPSRDLTVRLIAEGKRKLVMFPEGDVTGLDHEILPLKPDGIANVLAAQELANDTPVFALPIAFNFEVEADCINAINKQLEIFENRLGLQNPAMHTDSCTRITDVITTQLQQSETRYQVSANPEKALDERLEEFVLLILTKLADTHDLELQPEHNASVALYTTRRELRARSQPTEILDLLQQYLILASTMRQPWTNNIEWRLTDRMDELITGRTSPMGHRRVLITANLPPINLTDFMPEFASAPPKAASRLAALVHQRMSELVQVKPTKQKSAANSRRNLSSF